MARYFCVNLHVLQVIPSEEIALHSYTLANRKQDTVSWVIKTVLTFTCAL